MGGLQHFTVSPRPLGFGFGAKGFGPGLDNRNLSWTFAHLLKGTTFQRMPKGIFCMADNLTEAKYLFLLMLYCGISWSPFVSLQL